VREEERNKEIKYNQAKEGFIKPLD